MISNLWGMVLLVILFIAASSMIQIKLNRVKKERIKVVFFYCIFYYTALAGIKILSGDLNKNLIESFDSIVAKTYVHYAMVLGPISIICPVIIYLINKKTLVHDFMTRVITWQLMLVGGSYLLGIKISNMIWCIGFVLSGIIALALLTTPIDSCANSHEIKSRIKLSTIIFGSCLITEILFPTNELFLSNTSEFMVSYGFFFGAVLVGVILLLVLFVMSTCIMDSKWYKYFISFVTACTVMSYVQGNFLNGKMETLDGNEQTWPVIQIVINILIWVVVCLLFIYACKKTEKIKKICIYICAYIALIQIFTMTWMVISTKYENVDEVVAYSTQGMTELHESNNVVVFVLDWFDGQIMDEVENAYPNTQEAFKDFTYYKNASSRYAFTDMSIPYFITGIDWINGQSDAEYIEHAFGNSVFLKDIKKANYDMRVYTERKYTSWDSREYISNVTMPNVKNLPIETFSLAEKFARYKVSLFALKQQFRYYSTDIANMVYIEDSYSIDDILFYEEIKDSLTINNYDKDGAFRIYHLNGVHMPYTMTENIESGESADRVSQGIASVKIVSEYLEQMKELGVYDTATIIITADHGQNYFNEPDMIEEMGLKATSNPILYVKLPEQKSENGDVYISNAPVSHMELFPTVLNAMGESFEEYGQTFDMIDENAFRERDFYYARHGRIPLTHYVIQGNVRDENAWQIRE